MDSTGVLWIALFVLIGLSAIFSSAETAYSSFNRIRMKSYAQEGNKQAKRVLRIATDYNRIITAILIGNNIVNISASAIGTVIFTHYFGAAGAGISTIIVTILVLVGGEITPKGYAKDHAESVSMKTSRFLTVIIAIFTPFIFVFGKLKNLIERFGKKEEQPSVTEQELKVIIEEIEEEGVLEDHESQLVRSALDFDETTAEEALTPRVDMVSFEVNVSHEKLLQTFLKDRFSRIPIYEKNIDNIIGILYEKDFLEKYLAEKPFDIRSILQKPIFIPPQAKISQVLKELQKRQTRMAVVTDQYGGVEGIITLEDVLEELVGEIYDEDDEVVVDIQILGNHTYRVNPDIGMDDLCETLNLNEEKLNTESNTVGGWALEQFGMLPEVGDSFDSHGLHVSVEERKDKRITSLIITEQNQSN